MGISIGKKIGNRVYIHIDALHYLPSYSQQRIERALSIAEKHPIEHVNVVRIDTDTQYIALLHYPEFFDIAFPKLKESWRVDTAANTVSYRTYESSLNPPILHRKELLIHPEHPRAAEYRALTESAKTIGLFDDTTRIGYQVQWNHFIRERGYELVGHQLIPIGNDVSVETVDSNNNESSISRHRTALVRYDLSAPIKSLARYGFLDGHHTLFDYGCGRGDDVRGLTENDVEANGWDPYYAPENDVHKASIVNLGFVVNVIEDFDERVEALSRAYSLAESFMVVSVMVANGNNVNGRLFNDGVVTQRGTFQRYYTQAEISTFIVEVLDENPIPVGPGIFYIFRDKDAEQRFLVNRYKTRRNLLRIPGYDPQTRTSAIRAREDAIYNEHKSTLEALWDTALSLGRKPDDIEVSGLDRLINIFGTPNKAWRFISTRKNPDELEQAQSRRVQDISVYLALREFEQRRAYKHIEPGIKRDITTFFGSIRASQNTARELLFSISDNTTINAACTYAAEHGLGYLDEGKSLQLHTCLVEQLPPILRVYCGCASALYGDYRNADLVKIHINSGKLTLMCFDNFEGKPLPQMVERVKLKLREQDLEYFSYDNEDHPPPYLYHKARYINEEYPHYPEQVAFDTMFEALEFLDLSGYGPTPEALHEALNTNRWEIDGFRLKRSESLPDLDAPCGKYLTFRDLIECGETQQRTGIVNLPKEPDTYSALLDLTFNILDPVIDYFGMIKLTYGFCSSGLEKHIKKGIAPKLDQHAGHEKRRTGRLICDRRGAAVDFLVVDENMAEVVNWIAENTKYDRIYYYGKDAPIHVSYSQNNSQSVIEMTQKSNSNLLPRKIIPPIL